MPREDRRIIFEFQETYKAIYALCMMNQLKMPQPGMVTKIIENPADDSKVLVRIENVHDQVAHDVAYAKDFLAAALMLYCRTHRIPLPKTAQKSVEIMPDTVVLRVQV